MIQYTMVFYVVLQEQFLEKSTLDFVRGVTPIDPNKNYESIVAWRANTH